MSLGHFLSCLLGLFAAVLAVPAADATVIVDLGTAGRAASFHDTSCGKTGGGAVQAGDGITPARGGGCGDDGAVLSETFTIPEGAFDITLTIAAFSGSGNIRLQIDGESIEAGETCDDGDCERENGRHGGGDSRPRGEVIDDLQAGRSYGIDIRFLGFGNDDDCDDRTRAAIGSLAASLSYTLPSNVALLPQSRALPITSGNAAVVPEPASGVLLPAAVALLALRRRGWRLVFRRRR